MGLFDLPLKRLEPAAVAHFYASERVAGAWFWGRTLVGLGPPKLACLECVDRNLTLYDQTRIAVYSGPIAEVSVKGTFDRLKIRVNDRRYDLLAVDAAEIRYRRKPRSYLAYMDHFAVLDVVPGMGAFNQNFGIKGSPARKGVWVGLWESLLLQRGATRL